MFEGKILVAVQYQAPVDKPSAAEAGESLGGRPPEAQGMPVSPPLTLLGPHGAVFSGSPDSAELGLSPFMEMPMELKAFLESPYVSGL